MKAKKTLLALLALGALVVTACDKKPSTPSGSDSASTSESTSGGESSSGQSSSGDSSSDSSSSDSSSSEPEEEEYVIKVVAPSSISYSLNKTKAKKGEQVVLTITNVASGYSIKDVTLNTSTTLVGEDGVYSFTMPNRSAIINITVSVSGEVIISGDIAAVLEKGGDGIYVARDVEVNTTKNAYFSYYVNGTELRSLDLDENKCYADVTFVSSSSIDYELQVATGCTYDFYYDPAAQFPCYVIRKSVNYLPTTVELLRGLFDGSMRSESTVNYPNLQEIEYSVLDKTTTNIKKYNFDYKAYENNTSFAEVTDLINDTNYYVYKKYDAANKHFEVVDTFAPSYGNNDRTRHGYNFYGPYSANFEVVDVDSDDNGRFELSEREALHNVNHSSHYGIQLENEVFDAYYLNFTLDDVSYSDIAINAEQDEGTKNITVNINSVLERDHNGDTYTDPIHQANTYTVTFVFDGSGALLSLNYKNYFYSKEQWDFSSHTPTMIVNPAKTISATYSYGAPLSGTPSFSTNPYFINTIDSIILYNSATNATEVDSNGVPLNKKSYLHYNDTVLLTKYHKEDMDLKNVKEYKFTPSTALDAWQYGPTGTSDPLIIGHNATNIWNEMNCNNIGTATVTFTNHTKFTSSFDLEINVLATQKFHSLSIISFWGDSQWDPSAQNIINSTTANVYANTVTSLTVSATPSTAPVIYDAEPDDARMKVLSTTQKLTLDTTDFADITTTQTVKITLTSSWFQPGTGPTVFTFYVLPSVSPVGTNWAMKNYEDHVKLHFTDEVYVGGKITADDGYYKGYITDDGHESGSVTARFDFYYKFTDGCLISKMYAVNISSSEWSSNPSNYTINFVFDGVNYGFGVCLYETVGGDYTSTDYPIYGDADEGIPTGWDLFVQD